MSVTIKKNTILITRGDTLVTTVQILDSEGNEKVRNIYVNLMYDWETKEIFKKDTYGNWEISDIDESSMSGKVNRKFAEKLFFAAYNMNFFD